VIVFIDTCSQMKQEFSLTHGFIYYLFTIESLMCIDGWSVSKGHCVYKRKITLCISLFYLFKRKLQFSCNKRTLDLFFHVCKTGCFIIISTTTIMPNNKKSLSTCFSAPTTASHCPSPQAIVKSTCLYSF